MKIAIIDDSKYKVEGLRTFVESHWPSIKVCDARSFQTGMKLLEEERPDIILMDMTLPTSEGPGGRLDGRTRMFGGRQLMSEIEFLELECRVIIVTQFEEFPDASGTIDLQTLLLGVARQFPRYFAGGVFYGSVDTVWASELRVIIEREIRAYENTDC